MSDLDSLERLDDFDQKELLQKLAAYLADFAEWLSGKLGRAKGPLGQNRALKALVDDLGGTLKDGAPDYTPPPLDGIKAYRDAAKPDLEAWFGLVADVKALVESVIVIVETAIDTGDAEATTEDIAQTLLDLMAGNYVRERWPHLHVWMEFSRFATEPMTLFGPQGAAKQRFYGSIKALLKFALAPLRTFCGPPMNTEADARKWSDSTFLHLAGVFAFMSLQAKLDDKVKGTHSARQIGLDVAPEDETLVKMFYGWDQPAASLSEAQLAAPIADDISERMLSVQVKAPPFIDSKRVQVEGALRSTLAWVPFDHGGKGLFISVGGASLRSRVELNRKWSVQAEARADAPFGVLIGGPKNLEVGGPIGDRQVHLDVSLLSKEMPPGEYGFRFSLGGENGFHVGRMAISAVLNRDDARAQVSFHDCRLALDGSSFDNFIGSLLPKTQTSVEFSFGAGASTKDGLFTTGDLPFASGRGTQPQAAPRALGVPMRASPRTARTADSGPPASDTADDPPLPGGGSAPPAQPVLPPALPVVSSGMQGGGLPIRIPIGKSLGPVRLHDLLLNIDRDTDGDSPKTLIGAALSFSTEIGPITARIDRIGLKFALDFPDDRAKRNLHFANLDVGFIPPAGIGLAVETEQVKGGGFLFHDEANGRYAGVLELSLSGIIALKAIGILTTKLPNNTRGYSLLILVTAENSDPNASILELPMGWRLTGIGGLVAIHRTASEEALRAGIRDRTLESVMFPKDPVRNAPTIIAALDRVFPIKRGSYLFGVIVRLGWGVPTIITVELAVILEWAGRIAPNRMILLGRLRSILPKVDNDLLRLCLDVVGVFDFVQGTVAIDAALVDSRLLNRFPITGAAALRARWTKPRSFALAVGGMNKGFNPPAGFPTLERVAISLTTGDNPRLTCEGYFAITSNTYQYGARASLYAAAYGFNVTGEASYDVLIRLFPFHFLAEFHASMQLRKGSKNLFKVKVEGSLEGPVPLALRAKCTFEVLWWDVSIRVNVTLGSGEKPPLPAPVEPEVILRTALSDRRSWSAELPRAQSRIVVLREDAGGPDAPVRVHPLGTLAVRQSVVPLNLDRDIDKFGESPVAGARRFAVTGVAIEGASQPTGALSEDFAPTQFFEMSDEAKIAAPSFEPMQAGLAIGSPAFAFDMASVVASPMEYETRTIDKSAGTETPPPTRDYKLGIVFFELHALHGAAGRSVLRRERPMVAKGYADVRAARWAALAAGGDAASAPDAQRREPTFAEALGTRTGNRRRLVLREFELTR